MPSHWNPRPLRSLRGTRARQTANKSCKIVHRENRFTALSVGLVVHGGGKLERLEENVWAVPVDRLLV